MKIQTFYYCPTSIRTQEDFENEVNNFLKVLEEKNFKEINIITTGLKDGIFITIFYNKLKEND